MAKIVSTYVNDAGDTINVYESGAEYNVSQSKLMRPPTSALITPEKSIEYKRRQKEKAAAALRERIFAATQAKSDQVLRGPAHAVAEAGGILWDEIVLAPPGTEGVYAKDRIMAWEKIGRHAGILGDPDSDDDGSARAAVTAAFAAGVSALMARLWSDVAAAKQDGAPLREVVDGETRDAE